jgi:hypothetical protein
MSILKNIMGVISISAGIYLLLIRLELIFFSLFLIILGFGLIIFGEDENRIEEREDKSLNKRESNK